MSKLKARNVVGYPSLTPAIRNYAKEHSALLVFTLSGLLHLSDEVLLSSKQKVVVDGFSALLKSRVPILGFDSVNGIYHKVPLVYRPTGERTIVNMHKGKRLPASLFISAMEAKSKRAFLEQHNPKSQEYKYLYSLFDRFLPADHKEVKGGTN